MKAIAWTAWRPLELADPVPAQTLREQLDGGQAFRWNVDEAGVWTGVFGRTVAGVLVWGQYLGEVLPATHFLRIICGVMLKNTDMDIRMGTPVDPCCVWDWRTRYLMDKVIPEIIPSAPYPIAILSHLGVLDPL